MGKTRLDEIERALGKLDQAGDELKALKPRAGNFRPRLLQRVASGLGFELRPQRTSEQVWQHADGYTVAIPDHATDVRKGTAIQIIKTLQRHIADMQAKLEKEQRRLTGKKNEFRDYNDYGY